MDEGEEDLVERTPDKYGRYSRQVGNDKHSRRRVSLRVAKSGWASEQKTRCNAVDRANYRRSSSQADGRAWVDGPGEGFFWSA